MPLNGATRIMEMEVACIEEQGCTGPATLPARLFGGMDEAVSEEPEAGGEQATEPTPASVIIEGDQPAPEATKGRNQLASLASERTGMRATIQGVSQRP